MACATSASDAVWLRKMLGVSAIAAPLLRRTLPLSDLTQNWTRARSVFRGRPVISTQNEGWMAKLASEELPPGAWNLTIVSRARLGPPDRSCMLC
jgi:hypothetical protein